MKITEQLLVFMAETKLSADEIGFTGPKVEGNLLANILNTVYFWMAIVAVGFIVYGGYLYTLSSGDPGKIKKAKDVLLYAIIGIVVVLAAFVITNVIIKGVA